MKFGKGLFARFGRRARKVEGPDIFDLRLERIGVRERRCAVQRSVFRMLSSHPAV